MTGNKRSERGDKSISFNRRLKNLMERKDKTANSDKKLKNLMKRKGKTTSSNKRLRYIAERKDEATSSNKRLRRKIVKGICKKKGWLGAGEKNMAFFIHIFKKEQCIFVQKFIKNNSIIEI
ncbi:hypothetical protein C1645_735126 [Glomus cerebriforme]|uniref:Uncharacterized protein n=1 Tax=Glomus cerebriforme TaxID=658196 RepID=A0A397T9D2_9GLOM|nr:hypothetical protein C1645_735126 [Glomus cerebriforme]